VHWTSLFRAWNFEGGGRLLEMPRSTTHLLTDAGTWLARPLAFCVVPAYLALRLMFDRSPFNWHEIVTLATLCMALFIQRSEHRDMQAMHAKLDELLRAHGAARNELSRIDDKEPEQVEAFREDMRADPEK
jgi:low affinity Fe/Cu permease